MSQSDTKYQHIITYIAHVFSFLYVKTNIKYIWCIYIYVYIIYVYYYLNRSERLKCFITVPKTTYTKNPPNITNFHLLLRPGSWHLLNLNRAGKETLLTSFIMNLHKLWSCQWLFLVPLIGGRWYIIPIDTSSIKVGYLNCDSLTIQNGTWCCNLYLLDVLYTIHLVVGVLRSQKQTLN